LQLDGFLHSVVNDVKIVNSVVSRLRATIPLFPDIIDEFVQSSYSQDLLSLLIKDEVLLSQARAYNTLIHQRELITTQLESFLEARNDLCMYTNLPKLFKRNYHTQVLERTTNLGIYPSPQEPWVFPEDTLVGVVDKNTWDDCSIVDKDGNFLKCRKIQSKQFHHLDIKNACSIQLRQDYVFYPSAGVIVSGKNEGLTDRYLWNSDTVSSTFLFSDGPFDITKTSLDSSGKGVYLLYYQSYHKIHYFTSNSNKHIFEFKNVNKNSIGFHHVQIDTLQESSIPDNFIDKNFELVSKYGDSCIIKGLGTYKLFILNFKTWKSKSVEEKFVAVDELSLPGFSTEYFISMVADMSMVGSLNMFKVHFYTSDDLGFNGGKKLYIASNLAKKIIPAIELIHNDKEVKSIISSRSEPAVESKSKYSEAMSCGDDLVQRIADLLWDYFEYGKKYVNCKHLLPPTTVHENIAKYGYDYFINLRLLKYTHDVIGVHIKQVPWRGGYRDPKGVYLYYYEKDYKYSKILDLAKNVKDYVQSGQNTRGRTISELASSFP
jgi:hypothetical protein